VHHTEAGGRLILQNKVSIGDRVNTVLTYLAKAEFTGEKLAVDIIGDPSNGTTAQWHDIGPLQAVGEPAHVPLEHLKIGQQVMSQQDRLCVL